MDANPQPDGQPDPEGADASETEYAVRSREEIGGKKFRVGRDDAYVPFRNRKRRRRRTVTAVIGGLMVIGVGAYGLVNLVTAPEQNAAASACKPNAAQALAVRERAKAEAEARAAHFTLNVYNATDRAGLAARTATQLKQRGFVIGQVTNDPLRSKLTVTAQVRGGQASASELRDVAAEVQGAQIQTDSRNDPSIDLVLGSGFSNLASASQVTAALHGSAGIEPDPTVPTAAADADCGH